MFPFHTTTDGSFSCGSDQTATWPQVLGDHQQVTVPFDVGALISQHDLDRIFAPVADDFIKTGFGLSGFEAASVGAFNPDYGYTPYVQNQYNHMNMNTNANPDAAWLAPTPPLTDSDTIASPTSDVPWYGNLLPTLSAPGPQHDSFAFTFAAAAPPPPSHAEMARHFESGQSAHPAIPFADGNGPGGMMGPCFNFSNTVDATARSAKPAAITLGVADTSAGQDMMLRTNMPKLPRTSLRKRPRSAEEASNGFTKAGNDKNRRKSPRKVKKRRTGVDGVLEAGGSTSRACQKPADRAPVEIDSISEVAARGAGMRAAPIAHEIYHQFLPGPRVQEALMGTTAQGQSPWVEGRDESITMDITGNAVEQQDVVNTAADEEGEVAEDDGFRIPAGLTDRNQLLLMATPEERARGVVPVLRCVICPEVRFNKWENFIWHCEQSEAHPEAFNLCSFCSDFFARWDACNRHEKNRPEKCTIVSPAEAEEKRRVTRQVFEGFQRDLDAHLRFGRPLGELFAQRLMRLYPNSSKRGSRQQNRLKS